MPRHKRIHITLTDGRISRIILGLSILAFIGYFIFVSFLRHDNYFSLRLDLGNMDQTVWNVLHGHGFTLTDPMGTAQESRLAVHADFMLILLAPFYLIWSNPKMLLIIQTIVLALGAIPLYLLARKVLRNNFVASLFGVAYLLYPTVQLNTLHDFHATSITTTCLLFAYWFFVTENPVWFTVFAVFAALGKEQFWVIVAMLGIAWAFKPRFRTFGIAFAAVSAAVATLLFWKFIPSVTPGKHYWALMYLSDYGGSIREILTAIAKHPSAAIASAFARDRLLYYFQLLTPVSFLSLAAPITLIYALPNLGINVLSNNNLMRMIDYQYTSGITPWIFISAIYGFAALSKRIPIKTLSYVVAVCVVVSVYAWGELPFGPHSRFWFFHTIQPEKVTMDAVAASIPTKASVSATNNIGAHFSEREFLYTYPINADKADYDVILLGDQYAWPSGDEQGRVLHVLLADKNYTVIAQNDNFYAFKRIAK